MPYQVEVDWAPTYEMLISLRTYAERGSHKLFELGPTWAKRVREQLPPGFDEWVVPLVQEHGGPMPLAADCPVRQDARAFIRWAAEMPLGELYERVLAALGDPAKLPPNLGAVRDRFIEAFAIWEERYFRHLDPQIPESLAADAAAKRALVGIRPPEELVELATNGLRLEVPDEVSTVLLVPAYHGRPLNFIDWTVDKCILSYPVQVPAPAPGAIPGDLRSLTRALADDSRLLILRFLAGGVRSFTDVVKETGLAKSTVHHHLVTLRSCGLVRVHIKSTGADRFSLRPEAIDQIGPRLRSFLKGE